MLSGCIREQPSAPVSPLLPPEPPDNPQIVSAAWIADVFRNQRKIVIRAPARGLEKKDLQLLAEIVLEIDIEMTSQTLALFQAGITLPPRLQLTRTQVTPQPGLDLNCSGSAAESPGQASCPSGVPAANNVDRMTNLGVSLDPGSSFAVVSSGSPGIFGTGIQGLARLDITVLPGGPFNSLAASHSGYSVSESAE